MTHCPYKTQASDITTSKYFGPARLIAGLGQKMRGFLLKHTFPLSQLIPIFCPSNFFFSPAHLFLPLNNTTITYFSKFIMPNQINQSISWHYHSLFVSLLCNIALISMTYTEGKIIFICLGFFNRRLLDYLSSKTGNTCDMSIYRRNKNSI